MGIQRALRAGLAVSAVAMAAGSLWACGSSSSSSTGASTGSSAAAAAGSEEIAGKKVALLGCTNANAWCSGFNKTIEQGLKGDGVDVTVQTTNFDAAEQGQQMAQAIAQRPDLIVVYPADATAIVSSLRQAKQADVPVITANSPPVEAGKDLPVATIGPDHSRLGQIAAEQLQKGLAEVGAEGGNIFMITGTRSQVNVGLRIKAFLEQMKKTPQFKVVEIQDANWDPVKSGQIASQLFAKYRDAGGIVGAYGMADYMAAPIADAAKQAGLPVGAADNGIIVVGSNCAKTGIDAIRAGDVYAGALESPSGEAEDDLKYIRKFLAGEQISDAQTTPIGPITKDNVEKYAKECSY